MALVQVRDVDKAFYRDSEEITVVPGQIVQAGDDHDGDLLVDLVFRVVELQGRGERVVRVQATLCCS